MAAVIVRSIPFTPRTSHQSVTIRNVLHEDSVEVVDPYELARRKKDSGSRRYGPLAEFALYHEHELLALRPGSPIVVSRYTGDVAGVGTVRLRRGVAIDVNYGDALGLIRIGAAVASRVGGQGHLWIGFERLHAAGAALWAAVFAAAKLNEEIAELAANSIGVFTLKPSLEAALTISPKVTDKHRRIAEQLALTPIAQWLLLCATPLPLSKGRLNGNVCWRSGI